MKNPTALSKKNGLKEDVSSISWIIDGYLLKD
jgi:hypothetical protein